MKILPYNFPVVLEDQGHVVKLENLIEIAQGGPDIGMMTIDGHIINNGDSRFSGPMLIHGDCVLAPILVRKFVSSGFSIGVVNLRTRSLQIVGERMDLVLISKVQNNKIYYYSDMENTQLHIADLPLNCNRQA